MAFKVQSFLTEKSKRRARKKAVEPIKVKLRLKTKLLRFASAETKHKPAKSIIKAMLMFMSLCATKEAIALPVARLPCSLVTKYVIETSPLTDSAGMIRSTNTPYHTYRYAFVVESFTDRGDKRLLHAAAWRNVLAKVSKAAKK